MITVNNLTQDIAKVSKINDFYYDLDYGEISKEAKREVYMEVNTNSIFKYFNISAGCGGCTRVSKEKISESKYKIKIEYFKNNSIIRKKAYINYREENNELKRTTINIKGTVK